ETTPPVTKTYFVMLLAGAGDDGFYSIPCCRSKIKKRSNCWLRMKKYARIQQHRRPRKDQGST
ncbi:MAG: hypothetical protein WAK92_06545, partial [Thiobacillus sp.]